MFRLFKVIPSVGLILGLFGVLFLSGCSDDVVCESTLDQPVTYTADIAPMFEAKCNYCHNHEKTGAEREGAPLGVDYTTYTASVANAQGALDEIVAGERRWLAAQKAGLNEIPVTILDLSDVESLEVAIVENIQRDDLNPIEEAKGYKRLNEEFKYDHESISKLMSKSRSHISNTLRLLTLPGDVIAMLEEGSLTSGQARPLIGLSNASTIAEEIVSKNYSARKVEYLIRNKKGSNKEKVVDANILKAQERIEKILGLKVNILNKKNNSGKITIEYKDLEQFELVSELLTKH